MAHIGSRGLGMYVGIFRDMRRDIRIKRSSAWGSVGMAGDVEGHIGLRV